MPSPAQGWPTCAPRNTPPRCRANEDLLRAHVHAIFLREARLELGRSLVEVLDVAGQDPSLETLGHVAEKLRHKPFRNRTLHRALDALGPAILDIPGLAASEGQVVDPQGWLGTVLRELPQSFEQACERWRTLYRAALAQSKEQGRIVRDASRDAKDRKRAKQLRDEADRQLELLRYETTGADYQADFYSYRYFASEGFLPGYSFPRLPLSAYLPGHRSRLSQDEVFLTRPRFLAIAEFGPHSIIYHEGSRYQVDRAILPIGDDVAALTRRGTQCESCGYLHMVDGGGDVLPDLCEKCHEPLGAPYTNLFRMQNAATRRRDWISSDEEERWRQGYEIKTGVRFSERHGRTSRTAELRGADGEVLASLEYGAAATIRRLNLGKRRRADKQQLGYELDVERGYWTKRQQAGEDAPDENKRASPRVECVIPYVENQRNCLLLRPAKADVETLASLMAALKSAIQVTFQLEDRELAAEPLPDFHERRLILFYEATEGGAGVLRRLVDEPRALIEVAENALEICHFDPATGEDRSHAPGRVEVCEAACYDCLLSYQNQRDHRLLDRQLLPELLLSWMQGTLERSATEQPRDDHFERLLRQADSELEKKWLRLVNRLGHRLPTDAQTLLEELSVRPDFLYREQRTAVFVDGPPHDDPHQKERDEDQQDDLEDAGYTVIRFHHAEDWEAVLGRHPSVFGEREGKPLG